MRKFFALVAIFINFFLAINVMSVETHNGAMSPLVVVKTFLEKAMVVNNANLPLLEKEKQLGQLAEEYISPLMIVRIVGKHVFKALDPTKKESLLRQFRVNVTCKATGVCESKIDLKKLKDVGGFGNFSERHIRDDFTEVTLDIFSGGSSFPVTFTMEKENNVWRIADIKGMGARFSEAYQFAFQQKANSLVDKFIADLFAEVEKSKQRFVQDKKYEEKGANQ